MSYPDIRSLVPHQGPMSLLDRLLDVDDEGLCAEVTIKPSTLFCDGRQVGAWVGVEYMAQAIAAHAGYAARLRGEPVRVGFLLGTRRYQCVQPGFAVGMALHVRVQRTLQGENGLGAFECRIEDAASAQAIASATITVFQPENVNDFLQRSEG
jgi:predicted hotdog family 3-hydroxylacyl-ACP dehydratase